MTYYLGIDAGGSNCRARLIDAGGAVIGEGRSGSANARIGIEALYETLKDTADQAVAQAGLSIDQRTQVHAGMGIAGITRPGVRDALAQLDFGFASVNYATDAQIANLGAHAGHDGAILIIGTGSAAQLRVEGREFTIGGYGFPISDEGSGAALGLSAMRHALRALDGRTRKTPLSAAVTERFAHDTAQAIAWMDHASPRDYGTFAPLVMDYAEADDAIARSIVEHAAGHIERFIETIFERRRHALHAGRRPRTAHEALAAGAHRGKAERGAGRFARRGTAAGGICTGALKAEEESRKGSPGAIAPAPNTVILARAASLCSGRQFRNHAEVSRCAAGHFIKAPCRHA